MLIKNSFVLKVNLPFYNVIIWPMQKKAVQKEENKNMGWSSLSCKMLFHVFMCTYFNFENAVEWCCDSFYNFDWMQKLILLNVHVRKFIYNFGMNVERENAK